MGARGCRFTTEYVVFFSYILTGICFLAVGGDYLEEGDTCGDQQWKCRKLSACMTGQNDLKAGKHPEICSFEGVLPIVCCRPEFDSRWPPTTKRPQTPQTEHTRRPSTKNSISRRMCERYAQYVYRKEQAPILSFNTPMVTVNECGRIEEPLIVGGKSAKPKEFPHMAQIGYGEKSRIAWLCGGSLISERYVLSAAHCTHPAGKGPAKWARLGDLDISSVNDGPPPEIVRIIERIDHPDYNKIELYNDIALYKLERTITFTPFIRPLCLQVEHSLSVDETIATGWGHTQWGGRPSNVLQKVSLDLVPARSCNDSYRENIGRQLPNGILDSKMICAGKEEGKDTCQGDSGGPLQIPLRTPYCMYAQVGVTSFGRGCAENNPGVYTRVSYYVPWIESIVWPEQ